MSSGDEDRVPGGGPLGEIAFTLSDSGSRGLAFSDLCLERSEAGDVAIQLAKLFNADFVHISHEPKSPLAHLSQSCRRHCASHPRLLRGSPNPQRDGIWRRGLWEIIRVG